MMVMIPMPSRTSVVISLPAQALLATISHQPIAILPCKKGSLLAGTLFSSIIAYGINDHHDHLHSLNLLTKQPGKYQRRHNGSIALYNELRRIHIQLTPGDLLIWHRA